MSARKSMKAHTEKCGYCNKDILLCSPYPDGPARFFVLCPSCNGVIKYHSMDGRVVGSYPIVRFRYDVQLRNMGDIGERIAELSKEGCENIYMETHRGAAVIFRVIAELYSGVVLLGCKPSKDNMPGLSKAIKAIPRMKKWQSLGGNKCWTIANNLQWIKDLGDSSCHANLRSGRNYREPIGSNVMTGLRKLEEIISLSQGWK